MDEGVSIDVVVQLEPNPAVKTTGALPSADLSEAGGCRPAANALLATGNKNIKQQDFASAIRAKILAPAPQLQLTAANPVVLNAEFVESGRLVNNADNLALADNETPSLRNLTVNVKGALDG